tara:strand:- start:269 stop:736 length:468 start_codon:yes stop_codon:yes gene_type:complete
MISHLNKKNKPMIVDVSKKKNTNRIAIAQGIVRFSKEVFKKIEKMNTKKGEITNVAIIAGILGAKKTSDLIPLCHHVAINKIDIDIKPNIKNHSLIIEASVKSSGKTGVEMEALTAVSISCLTIYDMCKSLDKNITVDQIKLLKKSGGKSDYNRI